MGASVRALIRVLCRSAPFLAGFVWPLAVAVAEPSDPAIVIELGEVPYLSQRGQLSFSEYADAGSHKAFAISETGAWGWWADAKSAEEAKEKALELCARTSSVACALFAVNEDIVWGTAGASAASEYLGPRDAQDRLLPPVNRQGQARFREYLERPDYKAFAVGSDGKWDWWFGAWSPDQAEETALARCAERAGGPCQLFASGNEIVWQPENVDYISTLGSLPVNADTFTEQGLRTGSYIDESACKGQPERIWVTVDDFGYCIRYFTVGLDRLEESAIAYLHGDVHGIRMIDGEGFFISRPGGYGGGGAAEWVKMFKNFARKSRLSQPLFIIGRPGAFGSSGHHASISRTKGEWRIIDAALKRLGDRYGIETWNLAGQAGGSTIAAMLIAARPNLSCVALGSGGMGLDEGDYRLLDPMTATRHLTSTNAPRVYVLADPRDQVVPIATQRAYYDLLSRAGVTASFVELQANDPKHHGLGDSAIIAADLCAAGTGDRVLVERLKRIGR